MAYVKIDWPSPDEPLIQEFTELITFGRGPDCSVCIDDISISMKHACIALKGEDFFLMDLQSMNGVAVNGKLVEGEEVLKDGDSFWIVNIHCEFSLKEPSKKTSKKKVFVKKPKKKYVLPAATSAKSDQPVLVTSGDKVLQDLVSEQASEPGTSLLSHAERAQQAIEKQPAPAPSRKKIRVPKTSPTQGSEVLTNDETELTESDECGASTTSLTVVSQAVVDKLKSMAHLPHQPTYNPLPRTLSIISMIGGLLGPFLGAVWLAGMATGVIVLAAYGDDADPSSRRMARWGVTLGSLWLIPILWLSYRWTGN